MDSKTIMNSETKKKENLKTKNIMNKEVEHKNKNIFFQKSTGLNFNKRRETFTQWHK